MLKYQLCKQPTAIGFYFYILVRELLCLVFVASIWIMYFVEADVLLAQEHLSLNFRYVYAYIGDCIIFRSLHPSPLMCVSQGSCTLLQIIYQELHCCVGPWSALGLCCPHVLSGSWCPLSGSWSVYPTVLWISLLMKRSRSAWLLFDEYTTFSVWFCLVLFALYWIYNFKCVLLFYVVLGSLWCTMLWHMGYSVIV